MNIEVGRAYRLNLGEGNINNHTMHVRAIVDGDQVVVRAWSRRHQGWRYRIEYIHMLTRWIEDGALKRVYPSFAASPSAVVE